MMHKSTLIIISGYAATGKTTLSRKLAQHVRLPLLSKDSIKEILFDSVGHGDRAWGEKLNKPTYDILAYTVEQQLIAQRSLILETLYDHDFPGEKYLELQAKYDFNCIQVMCRTEPQVLAQRFKNRAGAADRHPGHNDQDALEEFTAAIFQTSGKIEPLALAGKVYEVDTTDFAKVNERGLFSEIEDLLVHPATDGLHQTTRQQSHLLVSLDDRAETLPPKAFS